MREPPHTSRTCFCSCHSPPDMPIRDIRWAPRTDPIGTATACSKCRYLHEPAPITEDDAA